MYKVFVVTVCLFLNWQLNAQKQLELADQWEFVGTAVEEPGYTIWGTSPIYGDDGKVHLFVARWPGEYKVDPGWRTHSEIAHYVGDRPEGPFKFVDIAVDGPIESELSENELSKLQHPKGFGPHNPTIHKVGDTYALIYISHDGIKQHPRGQYICMLTSKSLNGPWKKAGKDGVILRQPTNPDYWNYNPGNGVNNPALLQHPDGGFFLYFKSHKARMGVAIAENLEGPYVQMPFPVTKNDRNIEDGYAFIYKGKFCLLTTDNHGMIESGGGLLWKSDDGINFTSYEKAFHRINFYTNVDMEISNHIYGGNNGYAKFERPQVLLKDGKPGYLFVPSGDNIYGGDCTVSYVLKFKGK
ncbi:MAG: glycoside hydrolase family protein [Carboxylicivirga sp.]|jgi:hypothetical protein|nr:glycoside hydrolase family protein [Carboxylicivirga sp.]